MVRGSTTSRIVVNDRGMAAQAGEKSIREIITYTRIHIQTLTYTHLPKPKLST